MVIAKRNVLMSNIKIFRVPYLKKGKGIHLKKKIRANLPNIMKVRFNEWLCKTTLRLKR